MFALKVFSSGVNLRLFFFLTVKGIFMTSCVLNNNTRYFHREILFFKNTVLT